MKESNHYIDDLEENRYNGPNYMTLKEGCLIFQEAKETLLNAEYSDDNWNQK